MPAITNADLASLLDQYGALQGLAGESPFRVRAYHTAAESIRHLDRAVAVIAGEGGLRSIPGVGEGIAGIITEVLRTGTFRAWEEISAALPPTLLDILELPGVGPKTVTRLFRELGIADIDALEASAVSGALRAAPGFGPRVEAAVLARLESVQARTGRMPIGDALPHARALVSALRTALPGRIELAGSVRRFAETAADIDVVVESSDPDAALAAIAALPIVGEVLDRLGDAIRVRLQSGIEVDAYIAAPSQFGAVLVRATGSAAHLERLTAAPTDASDEMAVYAANGMPWIPPELRLGGEEFDRWREIPGLITVADIKGELHCHSTWSDGTASIAAMAAAAANRGYAYLGITDHSHGLGVAGGLDEARLRAQREELAAVAGPVRLLAGTEVEVARDGRLDFPAAVLAQLDVVVASLHVGLRQPRTQLMDRLEGGLRNPNVDIIAHPSGRLVERRPPGDFDWDRAFAIAAETGTALEINADPARLDLKREHAAAALAAGCLLVIDCDAHHPAGFDNIGYGVAVARQAWATPDRVVNTWALDRMRDWLGNRR